LLNHSRTNEEERLFSTFTKPVRAQAAGRAGP